MSYTLTTVARPTEQQGKGASRRLRKENLVPAIVYGGDAEPVSVCVKKNELVKALEDDAFFSSVTTLALDGENHEVVVKALQRHPSKGFPLHVDFQRIVRGQVMNFHVPVHLVNVEKSAGKKAGGILSTLVNDIEVSCMPRHLPEAIEVDVSALEIGESIHLKDVKLPSDVTLVIHEESDAERVIATMQAPSVEPAAEEAATEEKGEE
ncbi:50S ribosomal protein L25/general stress protein Ctc [Moraxella caviae]|uniref:Large ribosomal subunit protein bL25 n=1 Tax=Moraxella caviae TaxID=34060 RepID=A0A1T0A524_9GAMM|nr:50S ribosomal protein L25/general stress protein Ctc [Moraxella caviae]OOR90836.1 50S ribosomal protein L25/general stress protein Ctc [Moraxella caviae]STZ10669.1 General stress protein CTC [Moraxella caviae]